MNYFQVAWFETVRMAREKSSWLYLLAMPLVIIFILGSALSHFFEQGDFEMTPVRLAIVQQDDGVMREFVDAYLHSPDMKVYMEPQAVSNREEAERRIRTNRADFAVIIPEGFSQAYVGGSPASWEFILGQSRIQNEIAKSALQAYLDHLNVWRAANWLSYDGMVAQGLPAGNAMVATAELGADGKSVTAMQYYAASMLIMFLMYSGAEAGARLARDRENSTLLRLAAAPVGDWQLLLGRMTGVFLFALLQTAAIVGATALIYQVDWGAYVAGVFLICMLVNGIWMCLAVLMTLWFKTSKQSILMFSILIIVMTFLSGGYNPEIGEFLEKFSPYTINYWAFDGILRSMLYETGGMLVRNASVLAAIGGCLFVGLLIIYRKAGYHA